MKLHPFPSPEAVFSGHEIAYFVPLESIELDTILPKGAGLAHFLRPKMLEPDNEGTTVKENEEPILPTGIHSAETQSANMFRDFNSSVGLSQKAPIPTRDVIPAMPGTGFLPGKSAFPIYWNTLIFPGSGLMQTGTAGKERRKFLGDRCIPSVRWMPRISA